jgi:DNA-binding transcriptional regulator LsrR (DeoR family)
MQTLHPLSTLTEEEYRLCVRVARLYYENELTQDKIGQMLGLSRVKVNRVLQQARAQGIVEIRIHESLTAFSEIEHQLIIKYSLRDAVVVREEEPGQGLYLSLARGATAWLKSHLEPGIRIGLGLGRTISHLPQVFQINQRVDCTFTEVVGAASEHSGGIGAYYNITSKMAELVGGKAEFFYAPTFVSDLELKNKLMEEPSVILSMERARQCSIILQSVGPVDNSALLYMHGYLNKRDLEDLRQRGAVGDALGHYFLADGSHLPSLADDRVIGLELEDIKRVPWSVAIAGGAEKVVPIDAALKGKYFNVLITDRRTATILLALENEHAE